MAKKYELSHLGFLTLTFAHDVSKKELQRRWNNLTRRVIRERYRDYIAVVERGTKGQRLHLHVIIATKSDIRTGFDFDGIARHDYKSANPALRGEWAFLRKTLGSYGFGRHELLPIKSTAEGISKYVGKYIAKHIGQRINEDKGLRLVRYSKGARCANNRFMFASANSRRWRKRVGEIAAECGFSDLSEFAEHFGASWAYALSTAIAGDSELIGPTPAAQPDSIRRQWLPLQFSPLPKAGSGYSPRKEWHRRINAASDVAFRKRFRRFLGSDSPSILDILSSRTDQHRGHK